MRVNMWEWLQQIWSPVSAVGGAVLGAIALQVWARFRGRIATLRWAAQVQPFASSASSETLGVVEVLYNGTAVQNLYTVTIQVQNDSNHDFDSLELQIGLDDGSFFLGGAGQIRGSLRTLPVSSDYTKALNAYTALPADEQPDSTRQSLSTRRLYDVPVFNRGAIVELAFLLHAPPGVVPKPRLHSDHKGVRLKESPPRREVLGAPQNHAAWIGILAGLGALALLPSAWFGTRLSAMIAFVAGAFCILLGVGFIHLWRWLLRFLG